MYGVKEGSNVVTKADLQNLVTSVIFRQTDEFTLSDIVCGANVRLVGSRYFDSEELVKHCDDTINTLFLFDGIEIVRRGRYYLGAQRPAVSKR